jgi:hypothetical protein
LPHAHILLILNEQDKPQTIEDINHLVSAEIPDPVLHPSLHRTVVSCMSHGLCGQFNPNAPCMVDGRCSKRFPKQFQEITSTENDGYPLYMRRNNGRTYFNTNKHELIDNRHIVPYNPQLSMMFDCHINVEVCSSIRAVKYIYKYIYKGNYYKYYFKSNFTLITFLFILL